MSGSWSDPPWPSLQGQASIVMRLPAAPLRPYVSGYQLITVRGEPGAVVDDLLYPGWANLRFAVQGEAWTVRLGERVYDPCPAQVLFGATSFAAHARGRPGKVAGAGLTPLGWARLFGEAAETYADRLTPLLDLMGGEALEMAERLAGDPTPDGIATAFDAALLGLMGRRPEPDAEVVRFHEFLTTPEIGEVDALAERLSLSPRQVSRLTRRLFGFPPKLLITRHRFLRTLMALRERSDLPWSRRLDPAYHDQAQFIRDCRQFMGLTPSEFFALPRPLMEASTRARQALLGAGVQGLHPPMRPQRAAPPAEVAARRSESGSPAL